MGNTPNPEHVEIVKHGPKAIGEWRSEHCEHLNLREADLSDICLDNACLEWADLRGASLQGANLSNANLHGAQLVNANLENASLHDACLRASYVRGVCLKGTDLWGASFHGAHGIWECGPGGRRGNTLYVIKYDYGLMVKAGCFWGTIEEFATEVTKTHGDNGYARYYRAAIVSAREWDNNL